MNPLKWKSKFLFKASKWIFVPTDESVATGRLIQKSIQQSWTTPHYFYHLRQGGHVEALHQHINSQFFLRLDISNFFGSINRTRVTRSLKKLVAYEEARDWAHASTIPSPTNRKEKILPFGFVQSQIIASVCLNDSALGIALKNINSDKNFVVTVYVDDIIVSSTSETLLEEAHAALCTACERAGFEFNLTKSEGPANSITAFNVFIGNCDMHITQDRLDRFILQMQDSNSLVQKSAIVSYVNSINEEQANNLQALT
jgi:hypothetical protein